MPKVDPRKQEPALYKAPRDHAVAIDVPDEPFLSVDGKGSPHDPAFQDAIRALYGVAYAIKFQLKKAGEDHVVMPLEALWWWGDGESFPTKDEKSWRWRLMIRQPESVTPDLVGRAVAEAKAKRPGPALDLVQLRHYREGPSMQILHVGPYKDEATTIRRLHAEIEKAGYRPSGMHHEIYLGDPRRSRPENLRTLVRQPVQRA